MLPVVLFTLAVLIAWRWWLSRRPCEFAVDLDAFDAACRGEEVKDKRVYTRLAFEAAMACKDKYGEMRYNNANRVVAGDFVRAYLRENHPDLRVCDRVMHAQYAVELALTPTEFAVQASSYAKSNVIGLRRGSCAAAR